VSAGSPLDWSDNNENDLDVSDRPALFAAVVEGRGYRVHVAPRSRRLIALELAASGH